MPHPTVAGTGRIELRTLPDMCAAQGDACRIDVRRASEPAGLLWVVSPAGHWSRSVCR